MVMILFMEKWDDSNPSSWMKNPPSPTSTLLIAQLPNGQSGLHRGLQGMDTNTRFGLIKNKTEVWNGHLTMDTRGGVFTLFFSQNSNVIIAIYVVLIWMFQFLTTPKTWIQKHSTKHRGRHKWHSRSWVSRRPLPGRTERSLDQQPETGGRSTLMNR